MWYANILKYYNDIIMKFLIPVVVVLICCLKNCLAKNQLCRTIIFSYRTMFPVQVAKHCNSASSWPKNTKALASGAQHYPKAPYLVILFGLIMIMIISIITMKDTSNDHDWVNWSWLITYCIYTSNDNNHNDDTSNNHDWGMYDSGSYFFFKVHV
jgi:hypothetical protein